MKSGDIVIDYEHWIFVNNCTYNSYCHITLEDTPKMNVVILIDHQLRVDVFIGTAKVESSSLAWLFGKARVLTLWSQLQNLLGHFSGVAEQQMDQSNCLLRTLCVVLSVS